jgi:hypothetical protein
MPPSSTKLTAATLIWSPRGLLKPVADETSCSISAIFASISAGVAFSPSSDAMRDLFTRTATDRFLIW